MRVTQRLVDIARDVVVALHPEELADFDRIVAAHVTDPRSLAQARRSLDEPTAAGVTHGVEFFSALVLDVGVDVCAGLIANGAVVAAKRGLRRLRGRRQAGPGPDTVVPPVAETDVPQLHAAVTDAALRRGATADDASVLARELAQRWTRR